MVKWKELMKNLTIMHLNIKIFLWLCKIMKKNSIIFMIHENLYFYFVYYVLGLQVIHHYKSYLKKNKNGQMKDKLLCL